MGYAAVLRGKAGQRDRQSGRGTKCRADASCRAVDEQLICENLFWPTALGCATKRAMQLSWICRSLFRLHETAVQGRSEYSEPPRRSAYLNTKRSVYDVHRRNIIRAFPTVAAGKDAWQRQKTTDGVSEEPLWIFRYIGGKFCWWGSQEACFGLIHFCRQYTNSKRKYCRQAEYQIIRIFSGAARPRRRERSSQTDDDDEKIFGVFRDRFSQCIFLSTKCTSSSSTHRQKRHTRVKSPKKTLIQENHQKTQFRAQLSSRPWTVPCRRNPTFNTSHQIKRAQKKINTSPKDQTRTPHSSVHPTAHPALPFPARTPPPHFITHCSLHSPHTIHGRPLRRRPLGLYRRRFTRSPRTGTTNALLVHCRRVVAYCPAAADPRGQTHIYRRQRVLDALQRHVGHREKRACVPRRHRRV